VKWFLLSATHIVALAFGFALGVYLLPILTAPAAPDGAELSAKAQGAAFSGTFTRDLRDSDFLHWGEGEVSVGEHLIVYQGKLAPGPDYKLYLVPNSWKQRHGLNRSRRRRCVLATSKHSTALCLRCRRAPT